ncbi:tRNA M(5)U-54 methyltransferase [Amylolactobacillus amylotrophicus DSM 20534]|uniref:Methylenetetrahydrofolate--tRNA-(uracil-5-)-methyltransferase TrmFO n=3 Tax=Amylolactobacillus TaxID=2767876 RepID=A0A0R1YJZ1_9LACO|nr:MULTISPECIES: methylenetetrahydrofolate--tRNA-(uracil(54)-C(5))-methyltransferase (FADH(2)-oxidizing) TrmFO [Amylolactobacillus]APT19185.1 methylenetetrahydrofolate--tRNA-(uracil(54)-C(5))-methyltransferase (FADH(2)-oxidizing) TrmFO [Amylolactobacillus amylophilus DSM 20533 = JCM 1125]KRK38541.1 tRNA M(5)U-54 methyltransferase [Amylolactobacillus amylotrophicus DSM 20534]KRM42816.1 tRNA M(5)U-54 methyltransferase [Amylolactobacillus amylophilus DSM 20533 = JCM 1125]GED79679.1 methylenetetrah
MKPVINVIGGGLAGAEAAWQIAQHPDVTVKLYEMRPKKMTPAHQSQNFAELVCTNSMRSNELTNAVGLLKEEMRQFNSLIMAAADANRVPAGGALAVDRDHFSAFVTNKLLSMPNIEVIQDEVTELPRAGVTVVATGPLTSPALAEQIKQLNGQDSLHFFDAAAPIVSSDSIDMTKVYKKSRYDRGEAAYLNCPLTKGEFELFYNELVKAETAELHGFEDEGVFEGCMPIEVMAARGFKTMLFGPLKPVGLENPATGEEPFAVIQLRQDDAQATMYNIVGFQTHLKWPEQKRVFRLIPGLEQAEFIRYGVMHRNTYLNSPLLLKQNYESKMQSGLFFAGQMTGVEGYVESAGSGLVAGLNAYQAAMGLAPIIFPETTELGGMAHYITHANAKHFQPMNANFALVPTLSTRIRQKKERNLALSQKALADLANFQQEISRQEVIN